MKKIYKVNGGDNYCDYGAISFEKLYPGKRVGDICEELLGNEEEYEAEDFGIYREESIEDSDVKMFLKMRDKGDYDDLKHEKEYMEDEIIKS